MVNNQRIDKWLWATRIFKTRAIAAEACKKSRVSREGRTLKPAALVEVGDVIQVRKPPLTLTYKVKGLTNNRVGAKLVEEYLQNITPDSEYQILELQRISGYQGRQKGLGRPTKKERRDLEQFIELQTSASLPLEADLSDDFNNSYDDEYDEDVYPQKRNVHEC